MATLTFKELMNKDLTDTFLNTKQFAENVFYVPGGGQPYLIQCLIDENVLDERFPDSITGSLVPKMVLTIRQNQLKAPIDNINDKIIVNDVQKGILRYDLSYGLIMITLKGR